MSKENLIQLCKEYFQVKKIFNEEYFATDAARHTSLQRAKDYKAEQIADWVSKYLDVIEVKADLNSD